MRQKAGTPKPSAEKVIKDIRRVPRKHYGAEEKIRIVLDGLRGEDSIAALCRREGIAESLYSNWSKEFLEAGRRAGDTARAATTDEVKQLRRETRDLKGGCRRTGAGAAVSEELALERVAAGLNPPPKRLMVPETLSSY